MVFLTNLITVGNLLCGVAAVMLALEGSFLPAAYLILIGMTLDFLDGRIARYTNSATTFGTYFDSLADFISFGIAPVVLLHSLSPTEERGILLYFLLFYGICGILRLTRYIRQTAIKKSETFSGMPIPAAAGVVVSFALFYLHSDMAFPFVAVVGILILNGALMVSHFPYQHFGKIIHKVPPVMKIAVFGVILLAIVTQYFYALLFALFLLYSIFGVDWQNELRVRVNSWK